MWDEEMECIECKSRRMENVSRVVEVPAEDDDVSASDLSEWLSRNVEMSQPINPNKKNNCVLGSMDTKGKK